MNLDKNGQKRGFYKRTKEHRKLMSSVKEGSEVSEETKEKLRKANIGKRYSEEVNRKKSLPGKLNGMYGKKRPDLAEKNRNNPLPGKLNPAWIDGRSYEPYPYEFKKIRKSRVIFHRDNWTCQLCGDKVMRKRKRYFLTIHHIDYNKKNNNLLNLIALCNFCNTSVNTSRELWTKFFNDKLQEVRNLEDGKEGDNNLIRFANVANRV